MPGKKKTKSKSTSRKKSRSKKSSYKGKSKRGKKTISAIAILKQWNGGNALPIPPAVRGSGFPAYKKAKLLYYGDQLAMGDASTDPYVYKFNVNSIYDPDETGTGHQPKGRDIWATIYKQGLVYGCAYDLQIRNKQGEDINLWLDVGNSNDSAAQNITTWKEANETPGTKKCRMRGENNNTGKDVCRMKGYISMRKNAAVGLVSEDMLGGHKFAFGSEPTYRIELRLYAERSDDSTAIASSGILLSAQLTYYCVFWESITDFGS